MHGATALLSLLLLCSQAWAAGQPVSIICQDGDLHRIRLQEATPATLSTHEDTSIQLGPTKTVWLRLPDRATISEAQTRPIPVPDLSASRIELLVDRPGGKQELVEARTVQQETDGAIKTTLIRARISTLSYAIPQGCRVLAPHERADYARALLNNAGCLLPGDIHRTLNKVPGVAGEMMADCGWEKNTRMATRALAKAADLGLREAGWILSQLLLSADAGLQNYNEALVRLSRTAGLGHTSADLMNGIMRWRGDGLATNPAAAFATLLPHARRGSREAQGILGTMYLTGQGVPVNPVQAYAWCHLATAGAPLMYSDPQSCRVAAETDLSLDEILDARDLAVEIHNRQY